jgi:rifampicin phosphotransferase
MSAGSGANPWVDIEVGPGEPPLRYVGSPRSTRFPVYTRGNAGEVYPEVVWPLSYTTAFAESVAAFEESQNRTGVLRHKDFAGDPSALSGVFGGYAYLNLSAMRVLAIRSFGVTVDEVDRVFMGSSSGTPHVVSKADRSIAATLASIKSGLTTLRKKSLPHLDANARAAAEYLRSLPPLETATEQELWDAAQRGLPMSVAMFADHLEVSGQASVPAALLAKRCRDDLGDESMALRLVTGAGGVASAAPSHALWKLGRSVAGSAALTALFDEGVSGLLDRLRADDRDDVRSFVQDVDAFLARFGARGPNEWETACETWGTKPELALALVDRMRFTDASHDPALSEQRVRSDRAAALQEVRARIGARKAKRIEKLVDSALLFAQGREQAKTTIVEVIHGNRVLLREIGRRCAARAKAAGVGEAAPDDLWFVVADEAPDYLQHPERFAAQIAERRAVRARLASLVPPFTFSGSLPPLSQWERRDNQRRDAVMVGQTLSGIAGCPGVARGRARVILDPSDPTALGPGDVLVAPITDPAWTPLFVSAEAVVVDVGAQLSHAVIVSRELGIPCVVSVTDATRRIPDGALIEVDGTSGTVRVVEA